MTHPKIYAPPTPVATALEAVRALTRLPNLALLHEASTHMDELAQLLGDGAVAGARVHDARIAAICLAHGVSELWSADRDFSWFPRLRTVNPLVR